MLLTLSQVGTTTTTTETQHENVELTYVDSMHSLKVNELTTMVDKAKYRMRAVQQPS